MTGSSTIVPVILFGGSGTWLCPAKLDAALPQAAA